MADFPSIKPTARSYTAGQFPYKTYRGLSGATVKRVFGNRSFGHTMEMEFRNVRDTVVQQILDHYYGQSGGITRFALSDDSLSGIGDDLKEVVKAPSNISWEYSEPPSIETVFNGISNVTVRLVGELN
jgi:hypothetical protein